MNFMILFLVAPILSLYDDYISIISFDEGPSKNIYKTVDESIISGIPVIFHLDPFQELFSKRLVEYILDSGFEVGMSITEELTEKEEDIRKIIKKYEEEFIRKSGYKSVLLRLPAVGILSETAYSVSESMGYTVSLLPILIVKMIKNRRYGHL